MFGWLIDEGDDISPLFDREHDATHLSLNTLVRLKVRVLKDLPDGTIFNQFFFESNVNTRKVSIGHSGPFDFFLLTN